MVVEPSGKVQRGSFILITASYSSSQLIISEIVPVVRSAKTASILKLDVIGKSTGRAKANLVPSL